MQSFFDNLHNEGRVRLTSADAPTLAEIDAATNGLLDFEREYRLNLAGTAPVPVWSAVRWGAAGVYRAAQFLAYRELGPDALARDLGIPCPEPPSAAVCYSVDLSFRFLPDLIRLARAAAANDPLVERLMAWAASWPLSSVGISGVSPGPIEAFIEDESLRMLYVDRIIATKDVSRLTNDRVRIAVAAAIGAFPELAPEVAAALPEGRGRTVVQNPALRPGEPSGGDDDREAADL